MAVCNKGITQFYKQSKCIYLASINTVYITVSTNTRRCEHITPVLWQLHWLPVRQRVQFKITVLVYKALHNLLPAYLMEDC